MIRNFLLSTSKLQTMLRITWLFVSDHKSMLTYLFHDLAMELDRSVSRSFTLHALSVGEDHLHFDPMASSLVGSARIPC